MAKAVETYRGVAYPWHCDSMGHMNTQFYSALYDGASFHFLSMLAPYNELQKAGKQFELMVYPNARHGFSDPSLVAHMQQMMLEFTLRTLKPGDRVRVEKPSLEK